LVVFDEILLVGHQIFLKIALLRANWKECLIAELIGHASVPKSNTGKHLLFINANVTSSDAMSPIFPNIQLNA